jgi:hypothetical protein
MEETETALEDPIRLREDVAGGWKSLGTFPKSS